MYGFANGDPINFTDPFGLCKDAKGNDLPESECVERLKAAQDAAMRCPGLQPTPGATYCNQATLNVAKDMDASLGPLTDTQGEALSANAIAANLAKPGSGYREVTMAEAQVLANGGNLVIAALAAPRHGHVATLRPGGSGPWPVLANVGVLNQVTPMNWVWGKADRARVKLYTRY